MNHAQPEFAMRGLATLPVLFAAAIVATGALADPQPAPPTVTVAPATINGAVDEKLTTDDKMICKTEVPIGSRLGGHRVCLKKADWQAQSRAAQDTMGQRIGSPTNAH